MKSLNFLMDINVHLMMGRTESWDIPSKLDVEKNAQKDKIRETIDKMSDSKILFEITVRVKINSNFK